MCARVGVVVELCVCVCGVVFECVVLSVWSGCGVGGGVVVCVRVSGLSVVVLECGVVRCV